MTKAINSFDQYCDGYEHALQHSNTHWCHEHPLVSRIPIGVTDTHCIILTRTGVMDTNTFVRVLFVSSVRTSTTGVMDMWTIWWTCEYDNYVNICIAIDMITMWTYGVMDMWTIWWTCEYAYVHIVIRYVRCDRHEPPPVCNHYIFIPYVLHIHCICVTSSFHMCYIFIAYVLHLHSICVTSSFHMCYIFIPYVLHLHSIHQSLHIH